MREQMRPSREGGYPGPGALGSPFATPGDAPDPVTVSHGPYCEQLPLSGMSIARIRARFRDRFDIDPVSQAVLDGHDVGDDVVVQSGQKLMFARRAGEKGLARPRVAALCH